MIEWNSHLETVAFFELYKKIGYYFLFEQIFYRKRTSRALNNLLLYSLHLLK